MTTWPENKNPILTIAKENYDKGDMWGSNLMFLFALCDVATEFDIAIPSELEFSQGLGGSDTDSYEYEAIAGLLKVGYYIHEPLSLEDFRRHVAHALKVLGRYDSLLRLNGESY